MQADTACGIQPMVMDIIITEANNNSLQYRIFFSLIQKKRVHLRHTKKVWIELIHIIDYVVAFWAPVAVFQALTDTLVTTQVQEI